MSADPALRWRPGGNCAAVARLLRVGHCDSCHDDMDEGYDADEIVTRKGCVTVCCTVGAAWREVKP